MTKRFRLVYSQLGSGLITDDKEESIFVDKEFQKVGLIKVVDLLNNLDDENTKLHRHINSIIQLLDGVIKANEYEIEWATENNKDCSCIKYVNEEFEKIKRRLEEMQ